MENKPLSAEELATTIAGMKRGEIHTGPYVLHQAATLQAAAEREVVLMDAGDELAGLMPLHVPVESASDQKAAIVKWMEARTNPSAAVTAAREERAELVAKVAVLVTRRMSLSHNGDVQCQECGNTAHYTYPGDFPHKNHCLLKDLPAAAQALRDEVEGLRGQNLELSSALETARSHYKNEMTRATTAEAELAKARENAGTLMDYHHVGYVVETFADYSNQTQEHRCLLCNAEGLSKWPEWNVQITHAEGCPIRSAKAGEG